MKPHMQVKLKIYKGRHRKPEDIKPLWTHSGRFPGT